MMALFEEKFIRDRKITKIFFWLDFPSAHVIPLAKSLQELGYDVVTVCEGGVPEKRLKEGWESLSSGSRNDVIISPDKSEFEKILSDAEGEQSLNFLYGMWAFPLSRAAFNNLKGKDCLIALFLESFRNDEGLKSLARYLYYCLQSLQYRKHVDLLLACGSLGVSSYSKSFFKKNTIHEFGYFIEEKKGGKGLVDRASLRKNQEKFSFLYVGKLNERKNVKLLINALSRLEEEFELQIIGDGPLYKELVDFTKEKKISSRVVFLGVVSNNLVRRAMDKADCLVLPSLYDGWGAVVNESLSSGCKVVVSDNCGVSSVVSDCRVGEVFSSNDTLSLLLSLQKVLKLGKVSKEDREFVRQWYQDHLSPEAGAKYLVRLLSTLGSPSKTAHPPWNY